MNKVFQILSALAFISTRLAAQPVITVQPTNQAVLANNSNIVFSVQASGVGPLTYQWSFNGTNVPNDLITTIAGTAFGFSGDGGAATNAKLSGYALAVDNLGNVFIADTSNNRIRKVNTNGIITTFAGTNFPGFSGDGGAAANARLSSPSGVAVDHFGNVFIADLNNARIRKVNTNGIITTFAGNGTNGFYGDGGPATNAEIKGSGSYPFGLCFDIWGNLYIADAGNSRVRKIDTNGIITTIAGNAGFGYFGDGVPATNTSLTIPTVITADLSGNVFIADGSRVHKVDTNNLITTVAGGGASLVDGGLATSAQITPFGVHPRSVSLE